MGVVSVDDVVEMDLDFGRDRGLGRWEVGKHTQSTPAWTPAGPASAGQESPLRRAGAPPGDQPHRLRSRAPHWPASLHCWPPLLRYCLSARAAGKNHSYSDGQTPCSLGGTNLSQTTVGSLCHLSTQHTTSMQCLSKKRSSASSYRSHEYASRQLLTLREKQSASTKSTSSNQLKSSQCQQQWLRERSIYTQYKLQEEFGK